VRERAKKPGWLRVRLWYGPSFVRTRKILGSGGLATVCEEARCPNKG
jgi:lipoic acid synthetase